MRFSLLFLALTALAACDRKPATDVSTCNPSFSSTQQTVTVKLACGDDIPPTALTKLETYLGGQWRTSQALTSLIDKQRKEIVIWERNYREQEANLTEALKLSPNDATLRATLKALKQGDLEDAARLREQRFKEQDEPAADKRAAEAYQVGIAYQIAVNAGPTLAYLAEAHKLQPDEFQFGYAYAWAAQDQYRQNAETVYLDLLKSAQAEPERLALIYFNLGSLLAADPNRQTEASGYYQAALKYYRQLEQQTPAVYLPQLATTLNQLGTVLASDTQRRAEAEGYFQEALKLRRDLAGTKPAVYQADVAVTLSNLAQLIASDNQRRAEAAADYQEALKMYRTLAQDNPLAYQPALAKTLTNLANLVQADPQRRGEAEGYLLEALKLRREMAQANPEVYQQYMATALNNLARLVQTNTQRRGEVEAHYQEALKHYRQLAQEKPTVYQPYVANTLNALGQAQLQWQDTAQARITLQEAADLLRPFAKETPSVFGEKQASTLLLLARASEDAKRACLAVEEGLAVAQSEKLKAALSAAHADCDKPLLQPNPVKQPTPKRRR